MVSLSTVRIEDSLMISHEGALICVMTTGRMGLAHGIHCLSLGRQLLATYLESDVLVPSTRQQTFAD